MREGRYWVMFLLLTVVLGILQTSALGGPAGMPDLALLLACSVGLLEGPAMGAAAGFVSGALLGQMTATPVGLWALAHGLAGWAAGELAAWTYPDNLFLPLAASLAGTAIEIIVILGGSIVLRLVPPDAGLLAPVGSLVAWHMCLMLPIFWACRYLMLRPKTV